MEAGIPQPTFRILRSLNLWDNMEIRVADSSEIVPLGFHRQGQGEERVVAVKAILILVLLEDVFFVLFLCRFVRCQQFN